MDKIACKYCKIAFIAADSIFSLTCGHLIHDFCLDLLREDSKHCPTPSCCVSCCKSKAMRIFLPFSNETSIAENLIDEYGRKKRQLEVVERALDSARRDQAEIDAIIPIVNDARNKYLNKQDEVNKLHKEQEQVQKRIQIMRNLQSAQVALTGTVRDAERIVNRKQSADTLVTMATVLKSETARVKTDKAAQRVKLREEQKNNETLRAKLKSGRDRLELAVARSIRSKNNGNN